LVFEGRKLPWDILLSADDHSQSDRKMNSENDWQLDRRLEEEALDHFDLPLCRVLLRDEARYPWLVLVPRRANAEELFDLVPADQAALVREASRVAACLKRSTGSDKTNLASFGNVCRQLHVHLLARHIGDEGWPGGVVGIGPRIPTGAAFPPGWWYDLRDDLA
jgi:diadenosine tetraphosphate (Ap4A) HIT family hydrolase